MHDRTQFKDRAEAGKLLASKFLAQPGKGTLVLALPRGGVPIGYEIARALGSPLDTLVVRKIGAPFNPEYGVGAIAPGGILVIDSRMTELLSLQEEEVRPIVQRETEEMERRVRVYRSGAYSSGFSGDTVILVDDGAATGVTAFAAVAYAKRVYEDRRIVFAAPVCAREAADGLRKAVDEVVCLKEADDLRAIGEWYEDFAQVSDEEVLASLEKANDGSFDGQS